MERLEKGGLRALLLSLTGDREVRLSKERREALAARLQYDQARRDAEDLDGRIGICSGRGRAADRPHPAGRSAGRRKGSAQGPGRGDRGNPARGLDERWTRWQHQRREVGEALLPAGRRKAPCPPCWTAWTAPRTGGLGTCWGAGCLPPWPSTGTSTTPGRASTEAQQALSRFRTELADVRDMELPQVQIGEFATFADYFFDGFFMDW